MDNHHHRVLVDWFTAQGGRFDSELLTFAPIDSLGWSALALRDLQPGHTLFTIPRHLTLSTRTSTLPSLIGESDWKNHGLDIGWAGLILCLMWEAAQGVCSKWSTYLASLPIVFDTPMFWSSEDLEQLKGTTLFDKIGKEQAENDYAVKVVPLLKSRTDLFGSEYPNPNFSLQAYHIMGSRILSRSFQVETWSPAEEEPSEEEIEDDEDTDEDDDDDPGNVAMVPIADMLNARYGCENAKLFSEQHHLRMVTTRFIPRGEQIWNTYGEPPNSDLLRRYGHVDQVPLPDGSLGNPADIVEIPADLVVKSVAQGLLSSERVDWWLEQGGEDVFVVNGSHRVPDEMTSFVRLLMMSAPEWEKRKHKTKLPKVKVDDAVLSVVADVLTTRLAQYPTTVEDDEASLAAAEHMSLNQRNALVVRLGEKRILHGLLRGVTAQLESSGESRKRKADDDGTGVGGGMATAAPTRARLT